MIDWFIHDIDNVESRKRAGRGNTRDVVRLSELDMPGSIAVLPLDTNIQPVASTSSAPFLDALSNSTSLLELLPDSDDEDAFSDVDESRYPNEVQISE